MKLFCPECFKYKSIITIRISCHFEAKCEVCKTHIKFLNKKEIVQVLTDMLIARSDATYGCETIPRRSLWQ